MTTTNEEPLEDIIKTDRLGRVKVSAIQREKLLDTFEASAMSASAFAKQHGVKQQTFATWIQKRRRARGDYENPEIRRNLRMGKKPQSLKKDTDVLDASRDLPALNFIELDVGSSSSPASQEHPLEVMLPNGISIKIHSEKQLGLLRNLINDLQC